MRNPLIILVVLVALIVLVTACTPAPVIREAGDWQYFDNGNMTVSIAEVMLDSGRQCIVTFEGGIWCEDFPR